MGNVALILTCGFAAAMAAQSCGGRNDCARARAGGRAACSHRDATAVPQACSKPHMKRMQQLCTVRCIIIQLAGCARDSAAQPPAIRRVCRLRHKSKRLVAWTHTTGITGKTRMQIHTLHFPGSAHINRQVAEWLRCRTESTGSFGSTPGR